MNLNNKGWGLGVFLGFVALLLLCVIVAGVNAYKMGLSSDSPTHYFDPEVSATPVLTPSPTPIPTKTPSNSYDSLENKVIDAAKRYKNDFYSSLEEGATVSISLKNLMDKKYLDSSNDCSGYVEIKNEHYQVYLKCPNYVTEGYRSESDRVE